MVDNVLAGRTQWAIESCDVRHGLAALPMGCMAVVDLRRQTGRVASLLHGRCFTAVQDGTSLCALYTRETDHAGCAVVKNAWKFTISTRSGTARLCGCSSY